MQKLLPLAFTALLAACGSGTSGTPITEGETDMMTVYLTGYSYWDNTPPGSAAIARPVIHSEAGGTGTYEDPVTLAVGHSINGLSHTMDYPAGTRFYFPALKKYAIVEDLCGDGLRPQDGPCHSGHNGYPWLDIYIDGSTGTSDRADRCMRSITGMRGAIINPKPGMDVIEGDIFSTNCARYSQ